MSYYQAWLPLAARIRGLTEAAKLHAQYLAVRSDDTYGRAKHQRRFYEAALDEVDDFQKLLRPSGYKGKLNSAMRLLAADKFWVERS